jgi:hypothetical protein
MHRIVIEPGDEGWLLRRPGWPTEWLDSRGLAERAAESVAHEFHARSGRPACVVLAGGGEAVLARFG